LFGPGTKLGYIYECLDSGKYTKESLITAICKKFPGNDEATKRTVQVQLSCYNNGKYNRTLHIDSKGKLSITEGFTGKAKKEKTEVSKKKTAEKDEKPAKKAAVKAEKPAKKEEKPEKKSGKKDKKGKKGKK